MDLQRGWSDRSVTESVRQQPKVENDDEGQRQHIGEELREPEAIRTRDRELLNPDADVHDDED